MSAGRWLSPGAATPILLAVLHQGAGSDPAPLAALVLQSLHRGRTWRSSLCLAEQNARTALAWRLLHQAAAGKAGICRLHQGRETHRLGQTRQRTSEQHQTIGAMTRLTC